MERRFIFALIVSFLVLLGWSAFTSKLYHVDNKRVTEKNTYSGQSNTPSSPSIIKSETPVIKKVAKSKETYSFGKVDISFVESESSINKAIFKDFIRDSLILNNGFQIRNYQSQFVKESINDQEIVFVQSDDNKKITKRFIISNDGYSIELRINVQNKTNNPLNTSLSIALGQIDFSNTNPQARFSNAVIASKEKVIHLSGKKNYSQDNISYAALRDQYFCAIISPESNGYRAEIEKINEYDPSQKAIKPEQAEASKTNTQLSELRITSKDLIIGPGQNIEEKYHIYLGPQDLGIIEKINPTWSAVINYGIFDFIAQILLQLLRFFYGILHNWGWAIILLSISVYILLFPLSLKQMRSMKEMQAIQPKVEELREKYKDNPQKLNKEILELYREHKINPFGGCLPLILQLPVFFALYQALIRSVSLKGASFLWIKDLSLPDKLFILPFSIPILGNEFNVLPLIMIAAMFIQQKLSSVAMSGSSAEQQKMMLIIMPVMFGVIFYHMPSGLVLYYLVNTTLMLLYQMKVNITK